MPEIHRPNDRRAFWTWAARHDVWAPEMGLAFPLGVPLETPTKNLGYQLQEKDRRTDSLLSACGKKKVRQPLILRFILSSGGLAVSSSSMAAIRPCAASSFEGLQNWGAGGPQALGALGPQALRACSFGGRGQTRHKRRVPCTDACATTRPLDKFQPQSRFPQVNQLTSTRGVRHKRSESRLGEIRLPGSHISQSGTTRFWRLRRGTLAKTGA